MKIFKINRNVKTSAYDYLIIYQTKLYFLWENDEGFIIDHLIKIPEKKDLDKILRIEKNQGEQYLLNQQLKEINTILDQYIDKVHRMFYGFAGANFEQTYVIYQ